MKIELDINKDYFPGVNSGFKKGDFYIGEKGSGIIENTTHFLGCYIKYKPFNKEEDSNCETQGLKIVNLHGHEGSRFFDQGAILRQNKNKEFEIVAFSDEIVDKLPEYYQTLENSEGGNK